MTGVQGVGEPLGRDMEPPIPAVCPECRSGEVHCLTDPFCSCVCVQGEDE